MQLVDPLLIFDLGNVILRHDNALLYQRIGAACRNQSGVEQAMQTLIASGSGDRLPTAEFFEKLRPLIDFQGSYEDFEPLWNSHFSHDEAMEDLVRRLAARYRLVILSNTNDSHWRFLTGTYDILGVPHALYTSFELGLEKPDPAIYRHVLRAEGRTAEESVFIDDRLENVDGARALGIHGLHFNGHEALVADLAGLGITP